MKNALLILKTEIFFHIYGFELKWERCKTLGMMMKILKTFTEEIGKFLTFIDSIKDDLNT